MKIPLQSGGKEIFMLTKNKEIYRQNQSKFETSNISSSQSAYTRPETGIADCVNYRKRTNKLRFIFISLCIVVPSIVCSVVFYNIGANSHSVVSDNSPTVYITRSGTKYHKENCRHLTNSNNIIKTTANKAENSGYTPCSICKP